MDGYSEPVLPSRMRRKRQRSTETDEIGAPLCTKPWYTPRPVSEPRTYGTGGSSSAASPVVTPGFEQLSSSEKSSGTMQLEELSASTKGGPQTVGNHLRKHCAIVDQIFHQFEKSHGLLEAPSICKTESPGHPPSLLNLLDLWSSIQNGVDTELDAASLGHLTDIYLAKFSHAQPFLNVFPIREMVSQFIDRLALGNASGPWLPQCLCCGQSFWRQILHNAIILLVQALGSIAECSDYPSDGRISNVPDGAGSDGEDQSAAPHILGFAYYVCAGEALRLNDCVEENALSFDDQLYEVWALLLAGLYTGQLARVTESYHWIRRACRSWVELEAR